MKTVSSTMLRFNCV